ncbi:hypothetical protein B0T22DRAFT_52970 [Podospora appendiculata]|uniref:Uncharacterized protein n=1 Tax=Podospora appendiculata TaxID=314037 RepID=A0AAE1CGT8_9PEZI|nr:hypothetical protein B0T22DRAFT_52970 [Podospora appendiculata]
MALGVKSGVVWGIAFVVVPGGGQGQAGRRASWLSVPRGLCVAERQQVAPCHHGTTGHGWVRGHKTGARSNQGWAYRGERLGAGGQLMRCSGLSWAGLRLQLRVGDMVQVCRGVSPSTHRSRYRMGGGAEGRGGDGARRVLASVSQSVSQSVSGSRGSDAACRFTLPPQSLPSQAAQAKRPAWPSFMYRYRALRRS